MTRRSGERTPNRVSRGSDAEPGAGALEELFRCQYEPLVHLGLAITGNMGAAEEAAQESFVSACSHWDQIRDHPRPELWLRRVLINHCHTRWRRLRSESRALLKLRPVESWHDTVSDTAGIWQAVRTLPRRQAQAIALAYADQLSLAEAAVVLGCSAETVSTHLRRGRAALARKLEAWNPNDDT